MAAKILMKIMYSARYGRPDLLRAISHLATMITKWDELCDKKLFRIIKYLNFSKKHRLFGFIGDDLADLTLQLFTDADFAGSKSDMKSTSGIYFGLSGPNSFYPLSWISKKQTAMSHSTPEAELVSMALGIRGVGLPAILLWKVILGREPQVELYQDNTATTRIAWTGKAPTLRHIQRTHSVCITWINDVQKSLVTIT